MPPGYGRAPFATADKDRQRPVNHQFILGAAQPALAWRAVARSNSRAGGIFLTVGIFAGFGWGIAVGEPMKGILAGTAIGAAAALLLWLLDRRG